MPNLIFGTKGAAEVLAAQAKMNREARVLAGLYKEDVREAKNLENAAKRIYTSLQTPQEKVLKQIRTIAKAHKEGFVDRPQAREGIQKLRAEMKRLNEEQGKTVSGADKAFKRIGLQVASIVGSTVSVAAAVQTVRAELQKITEVEAKRTQTQTTAALAEEELRINAAALSPVQRQSLVDRSKALAFARNAPLTQTLQAASTTISGTGDPELTLKLVGTALQLTKDPNNAAVIAGGLADIISVIPAIKDPADAAGFLTLAQSQSRITSPAKTAEALSRASSAITAQGGTGAEAAGLLAAISKGSGDKEGNISSTAVANLVLKTASFFNKEDVRRRFPVEDTDTFSERLKLLLRDKELGTEFINASTFRAGALGGISKLFQGDPFIRQTFLDTQALLADPSQRAASAASTIEFVKGGNLQRALRTERAVSSALEKIETTGEVELSPEARKNLNTLLAKSLEQSLTFTQAETFVETGITTSRQEAINRASFAIGQAKIREFGLGEAGPVPISAESKEATEELRSLRDTLGKLGQEQLEEQKETNRKLTGKGLIGVAN